MLDRIIDEVCYDDSEEAKEILNEVIENMCKNAEERVILVKDKLNQAHVAVKRTWPSVVCLRNGTFHHLAVEVIHSLILKFPAKNHLKIHCSWVEKMF